MSSLPKRRVLAAAACAALAACQPSPTTSPAASGPATTAAPASPLPGASSPPVTPSGSGSAARLRLEVAPDGPFLGPDDGPAGAIWVMPAAATRDRDGNLVLVIVWFDAGNLPPKVTISTSADGATWDVGHESILADLDIGDPAPGPIPAAIVQLDDGSWQLYGWAAADPSGRRSWTWRASAADLGGPWALDRTEMLLPGSVGAWDSQTAAPGPVMRTTEGYRMWYEGEPPGSTTRGDIGLATSPDGLEWTKFDDPATSDARLAESDPVIPTGICGTATDMAVEQPQVERMGDGYVALFGGFSAADQMLDVFGATSTDGRTWACASSDPLLRGDALGAGEGIHTIATTPIGDGRIALVAESIVSDHSELWWATVEVLD